MSAAWMTSRRDEYDVDEDGGEVDAGSVDDSKMGGVRWLRVQYDEGRRKKGWTCGLCRRIQQAELW